MKREAALIPCVLLVLTLSACGAAAPQPDKTAENGEATMWAVTTTSDEARQQIEDGFQESDMGRPEEAFEHFKRAMAADPNSAIAFAAASSNASTPRDAATLMAKAVELAPKASEIERAIVTGVDKLFHSDLDGALASAQQVVKLDPKNARSWLFMSVMDSAAGKVAESRADLEKAAGIAPKFAVPYIHLSASYSASEPRDFAKAEQYARKAVDLAPNEGTAHDMLGDALRMQDHLEEAGQEYTKEADLDPTQGDGLQQRGHVNLLLGRFDEARADYRAAAEVERGNAKAVFALYPGLVTAFEGHAREAYAEFDKGFSAVDAMNVPDPISAKAAFANLQFLIACYNRMLPEAASSYARQVEMDKQLAAQLGTPESRRQLHAVDLYNSAIMEIANGRPAAARATAAEYMKLMAADRSPQTAWSYHGMLGLAALNEKKYAEAITHFDQAGTNLLYVYSHGLALEGAGREAEAQAKFKYIADYRFVPFEVALVRRDALAKLKKAS